MAAPKSDAYSRFHTEFEIQAGVPRVQGIRDGSDRSLSDALQTVFPMETEDLLLRWHIVRIAVNYKYDFSLMIDDVIGLIREISAKQTGTWESDWRSNTFDATWTARWEMGNISIDAVWRSVAGGVEGLLSAAGPISLTTDAFLAEWKRPLVICYSALGSNGYSVKQIPTMAELANTIAFLPREGRLYGC